MTSQGCYLILLICAVHIWSAGGSEDQFQRLEASLVILQRQVAEQEKRILHLENQQLQKDALAHEDRTEGEQSGSLGGVFAPGWIGSDASGTLGCASAGPEEIAKSRVPQGPFSAAEEMDGDCSRLYVVTYATEIEERSFCLMAESAAGQGLAVNVLGLARQAQFGEEGRWDKLWAVQDFVDSLPKEECSVLLFTDELDVLFADGAQGIVQRFLASQRAVLFASERACCATKQGVSEGDSSCDSAWPEPQHASPSPYLSSAAFIGYTKDIQRLLKVTRKEVEMTRLWAKQKQLFFPYDDDPRLAFCHAFAHVEAARRIGIGIDVQSDLFCAAQSVALPDSVLFDLDGRLTVYPNASCAHLQHLGASQSHLASACLSGAAAGRAPRKPALLHFERQAQRAAMQDKLQRKMASLRKEAAEDTARVEWYWDVDRQQTVRLASVCREHAAEHAGSNAAR